MVSHYAFEMGKGLLTAGFLAWKAYMAAINVMNIRNTTTDTYCVGVYMYIIPIRQ